MIIFTSICANYLHKAMTLASSVKGNIPDAQFVVCLLERILPDIAKEFRAFDHLILAKETWGTDFDRFIFKHDIVEASTAVKARFLGYLFDAFPKEDKFIYLDPDIYVYADFTELRTLLDTQPIVLCPHLLQPGNIEMELSTTAHGTYNLGFLAVKRCEESRKLVNWWAERLSLYCYDDMARGIFTDQKWMDLAPCFFDAHIFKHRGYDFATWSLLDCGMEECKGQITIKGDPLRFIHYSGYGPTIDDCVRRWLPDGYHPYKHLLEEYKLLHDRFDANGLSKTPWAYDYYNSGEKVDRHVRQLYREHYENIGGNPFEMSNAHFMELFGISNIDQSDKPVINIQRKALPHALIRAGEILGDEGFSVLLTKVFHRAIINPSKRS